MCRVIAIANHKGGVAKTTTVASLGIGLANKGYKVLLVDTDGQADLTKALWRDKAGHLVHPSTLTPNFVTMMNNIITKQDFDPHKAILHHPEGVDLIPSNIKASNLELALIGTMSRELVLDKCIRPLKEDYDYIVIDSLPSLDLITVNVLACADTVLIPVQAEFLAVEDLEDLIGTIQDVKEMVNPKLWIEGILITMADPRTNYGQVIKKEIIKNYSEYVRVFECPIPRSVRASEISALGISIYKHAPGSKVERAYSSLVEEVIQNGK